MPLHRRSGSGPTYPLTTTADRNAAYLNAAAEMKKVSES